VGPLFVTQVKDTDKIAVSHEKLGLKLTQAGVESEMSRYSFLFDSFPFLLALFEIAGINVSTFRDRHADLFLPRRLDFVHFEWAVTPVPSKQVNVVEVKVDIVELGLVMLLHQLEVVIEVDLLVSPEHNSQAELVAVRVCVDRAEPITDGAV